MAPHYVVRPTDPAGHRFTITLTVEAPDPDGQLLRIPAWIPGSYMIREFSRNIVEIRASSDGAPVPLQKLDKDTWQAAAVDGPLSVTTVVYAWDLSVRTAHLDQTHAFFNGTSLFLAVVGQEHGPQRVTLLPPDDPACAGWRVATTLPRISGVHHGFGTFECSDYDELVDHPVEMGTWTLYVFEACGVIHEVAITGLHTCDGERLCTDLKAICEHHIRFFGEPAPVERYLFQTTVVGDGYGGLEHRSSTALIASRDDLPQVGDDPDALSEGYRRFLGLCSHEYFHTWNVKRIKPAAFVPYDLNREGHTTLLWAFEGVTSYFDDLGVLHAGCMKPTDWLELMGQMITRVRKGPGRGRQSLSDSSFDAWTKFYRQDENAPNAIVSYYAKGALVALALDLTLRRDTDGAVSLDDVWRELWERYGKPGIGVPEDGIEKVAAALSGLDLDSFFETAIRGTDDLPLTGLLRDFGLVLSFRPADGPQDKGGKTSSTPVETLRQRGELGARVVSGNGGAKLASVYAGGAAHTAGLSAGDVVIAADGLKVSGVDLVKRLARRPPGSVVAIHAFRRDELMRFRLTLQAPQEYVAVLTLEDDVDPGVAARRHAWLGC
ncbi:MAG: PDZ domain-containing protein [Myxococcota bacterium]|nr:PDZ domain-containing protein [Myxococcota bacterium]